MARALLRRAQVLVLDEACFQLFTSLFVPLGHPWIFWSLSLPCGCVMRFVSSRQELSKLHKHMKRQILSGISAISGLWLMNVLPLCRQLHPLTMRQTSWFRYTALTLLRFFWEEHAWCSVFAIPNYLASLHLRFYFSNEFTWCCISVSQRSRILAGNREDSFRKVHSLDGCTQASHNRWLWPDSCTRCGKCQRVWLTLTPPQGSPSDSVSSPL